MCLDNQKVNRYFEETGTIEKLEEAFQIPNIRSAIQQLVAGMSVSIHIKNLSPEDLVHYKASFYMEGEEEVRLKSYDKTLELHLLLPFMSKVT